MLWLHQSHFPLMKKLHKTSCREWQVLDNVRGNVANAASKHFFLNKCKLGSNMRTLVLTSRSRIHGVRGSKPENRSLRSFRSRIRTLTLRIEMVRLAQVSGQVNVGERKRAHVD